MPRVFPLVLLAFFTQHSALSTQHLAAQDPPEKAVTLRWFGQSFFQLETNTGKKIVFDPHGIMQFGRPVVTADVVLISHPHNDHNQLEALEKAKAARVFEAVRLLKNGRTEWNKVDEKVGQVKIRSLGTYHDATNGMQRGKNGVWVVEVGGVTFCHLGDLGHELTPEQVKALGPVDVLMVPVGGIYTLNGEQAKAVVNQIKPRLFVLPMHYGVPGFDDLVGPDEFLDGQKKVTKLPDTNELAIPADAKPPADGPTVVLLGWQKAPAPKKP
jgi:L-ascorbate metabolism protein UlaG (beta-lactamase superfamily)